MRLLSLVTFVWTLPAFGQGFNIDFGPAGQVSPSSGYGAASGQVGYWNPSFGSLMGLSGNASGALISGGSIVLGSLPISGAASGDNELMNDGAVGRVLNGDDGGSVAFNGLQSGQYRLYVYAFLPANSDGTLRRGRYRVFDSNSLNSTDVNLLFPAVWPGQQVLNQTYFTYDFSISSPSQYVQIFLIGQGSDAVPIATECAGLQIVPIPTPGATALLGVLGLTACRRRR